jgi:hypothetical protein
MEKTTMGEFYPCSWCGSTGTCEHLAMVLTIEGNPPIPVRARGGLAEAQQRAAQALVGMWRRTQKKAVELASSQAGQGEGGALVLVMFLALVAALVWAAAAGLLRPDWDWWRAFVR